MFIRGQSGVERHVETIGGSVRAGMDGNRVMWCGIMAANAVGDWREPAGANRRNHNLQRRPVSRRIPGVHQANLVACYAERLGRTEPRVDTGLAARH
jgi:hypothetical protein